VPPSGSTHPIAAIGSLPQTQATFEVPVLDSFFDYAT
jgi:hypothetical protein